MSESRCTGRNSAMRNVRSLRWAVVPCLLLGFEWLAPAGPAVAQKPIVTPLDPSQIRPKSEPFTVHGPGSTNADNVQEPFGGLSEIADLGDYLTNPGKLLEKFEEWKNETFSPNNNMELDSGRDIPSDDPAINQITRNQSSDDRQNEYSFSDIINEYYKYASNNIERIRDKIPESPSDFGEDLKNGLVAGVQRAKDRARHLANATRNWQKESDVPAVTDQGTRPYVGKDLPSSFTGEAFNSAGSVPYMGTRTGATIRGTYNGDAPGTFVGVINRSGFVSGRYTEGSERGTFTGIADPKLEHIYGHSECTSGCE